MVSFKKTDLHCLDAVTGELVWAAEGCRSPELPAVFAASRVWTYSPTAGPGVAALSLESGEALNTWEGRFSAPIGDYEDSEGTCVMSSRSDFRFLPQGIGRIPRNRAFAGKLRRGKFVGLVAPERNGEREPWAGLICYDAVSKKDLWLLPTASADVEAMSGTVVILKPHEGNQILVRSVDDGRELWSFESETARTAPLNFAITSNRVFHYEMGDAIARDLATGEIVWTRATQGPRSTLLATRGLIWQVFQPQRGKQVLRALSQETGKTVWAQAIKGNLRSNAIAWIGSSLLLQIGGKLVCYREA